MKDVVTFPSSLVGSSPFPLSLRRIDSNGSAVPILVEIMKVACWQVPRRVGSVPRVDCEDEPVEGAGEITVNLEFAYIERPKTLGSCSWDIRSRGKDAAPRFPGLAGVLPHGGSAES